MDKFRHHDWRREGRFHTDRRSGNDAARVFPWLPDTPTDIGRALKIWRKLGPTTVYWHYHFSVYGKFESKKAEQLMEIRELLSADTSPAA